MSNNARLIALALDILGQVELGHYEPDEQWALYSVNEELINFLDLIRSRTGEH